MSSTDVGAVGQADATSAAPVSAPSLFSQGFNMATSSMNPFGAITGAVSSVGSSVLSNWALVAVGVVLVIGALLISQKETVIQVASKAGEVAA